MKRFLIGAAIFVAGLTFGSCTTCHAREQREFRRGQSASVYAMQCEAIRQGHAKFTVLQQWTGGLPAATPREGFVWYPGRPASTDSVP
jgi:hypothetical protein